MNLSQGSAREAESLPRRLSGVPTAPSPPWALGTALPPGPLSSTTATPSLLTWGGSGVPAIRGQRRGLLAQVQES